VGRRKGNTCTKGGSSSHWPCALGGVRFFSLWGRVLARVEMSKFWRVEGRKLRKKRTTRGEKGKKPNCCPEPKNHSELWVGFREISHPLNRAPPSSKARLPQGKEVGRKRSKKGCEPEKREHLLSSTSFVIYRTKETAPRRQAHAEKMSIWKGAGRKGKARAASHPFRPYHPLFGKRGERRGPGGLMEDKKFGGGGQRRKRSFL